MRKKYSCLLLVLAITIGYSAAAQAEDERLSVPPDAIAVPVGNANTPWTEPPPPSVDQGIGQAVPAPETVPNTPTAPEADLPDAPTDTTVPLAVNLLQTVTASANQAPVANPKAVELSFGLPPDGAALPPDAPTAAPEVEGQSAPIANLPLDSLFSGDSNSLVAKAVGSAEGTRTPEGERTPAYYGHIDPGNKAWNQGSFSYQHSAASPEEADRKQLQRLQDQAAAMQTTAIAQGIRLTLEEALNGIDLANQAPKAALDRDGYIDWLARAHAIGKTGDEAILWARVQSYIDPATQRWNAPGLGNSEVSISQDQARRMAAIARTIDAYQLPAPQPSPALPQLARTALQDLPEEIGIARLFAQPATSPP